MANPDCEKILNLIPLYVDGLLKENETDEVKGHIKTCEKCKKELLFMESIVDKTKTLPDVEVPDGFCERIMSSAERIIREKRRRKIKNIKRTAASLVACAAVVLVSFVTLPESAAPDEKILIPKISENPVSIERKTSENKKTEKPIPVPVQMTEEIPVAISEETEDIHDVFCVTTTEETQDLILSYLSDYEKDDTGYIVENIDEVIEFFVQKGINAEKITEKAYKNHYIIVK